MQIEASTAEAAAVETPRRFGVAQCQRNSVTRFGLHMATLKPARPLIDTMPTEISTTLTGTTRTRRTKQEGERQNDVYANAPPPILVSLLDKLGSARDYNSTD